MEYVVFGIAFIIIIVCVFVFGDKSSARIDKVKSLTSDHVPQVSIREQQIEDSGNKIKDILLTLADVIHNVGSAADASSTTLNEARVRISNLQSSQYVEEATVLIDEIDSVVSANSKLKNELTRSQGALHDQQKEIGSLRTAVRKDSLTGLNNRAALDEYLDACFNAFSRDQKTFSLLMLDIDEFKAVNDQHGHQAGDRILKGLGDKFRLLLRVSDFISRYGGEEFAIILPKSKLSSSRRIAEKVRSSIEKAVFNLDNLKLNITVSVGVAEVKAEESKEDLIKRADKALYLAKEKGRNQVC